jgi:predicted TIM-barrel fold metal-dependent hydrolase
MKKLDAFNHIWPTEFYKALADAMGAMTDITRRSEAVPMMTNLDERFRIMDLFGDDYQQILSLASPPIELAGGPETSRQLSRIGNDGMAELCAAHPDRFPGFIASIAMNDTDGVIDEINRSIGELGACGVQVYTNVNGKPLDTPEFRPVFERMHELDKPIWIHPARGARMADYASEDKSHYEIWWTFGWPYESSAAQARLVWSKIMTDLPNLKVITHHAGGMTPFFEGRVGPGWDQMGARTSSVDYSNLPNELGRPHLEIFKSFYADTATFGSSAAVECALSFYGVDHILFASDAPFDPEKGPMYIRETIRVLDELDISDSDRQKIYYDNLANMIGLN